MEMLICSQCGAPLDTGGRCLYCQTLFREDVYEIGDKAKVIAAELAEYYQDEIGTVTNTVNDVEPHFPIELTFDRQPKPFVEYFEACEIQRMP